MAGINWDNVGSAYVPSVNLVNGHDKLIDNMSKATALVDSVFKDKRSLDEKNDATIKERNTTDIEMRLASGELKPEDLAGMSGVYMDSSRITKFVDSMRTQEHNDNILNEQIRMRKEAEKVAAHNKEWQETESTLNREDSRLLKKNDNILKLGALDIQKKKQGILNFEQGIIEQQKAYATKAAVVAKMPYDKQQEYFNNPDTNAEEALAVRGLWSTKPKLYGEANNNFGYSVENQGIVDKFGIEGVPTLADEKAFSKLSSGLMSRDSDVSKKSLAIAKKVSPGIDNVLSSGEILRRAGELAQRLGYEPSELQIAGAQVQEVGNFYANLVGKNSLERTNNDVQITLLTQMVDSLPDNSPDRIDAENLLQEAKETSLSLGKGRNTVSAAQIRKRLKQSQYGLSKYTRASVPKKKGNNVDGAIKSTKKKNEPKDVAKNITK